MKTVLVTGGSGLIGKVLIHSLLQKGYKVRVLSRSEHEDPSVEYYVWDINKKYIDPKALIGVDSIIHLAGASIGEEKWSSKRKKVILDSRVKSAELLFDQLSKNSQSIESFISSSAIGYYGAITDPHIFEENDPPYDDFMAETCVKWEEAADLFSQLNARVLKIRTGLVLSKKGGILSRIKPLVNAYIGSPLGNGKQYMPWIHLNDLVDLYLYALANKNMEGAYNAVAPEHVTNVKFMSTYAASLNKKIVLPAVPAFILNIVYGEMAVILTKGSRVSSKKISDAGFNFTYPTLQEAMESL